MAVHFFKLFLTSYDIFLSSHFSQFLHDKCNFIISKVHCESIKKKSTIIFNTTFNKVYCSMGN